MPKKQIRNSFYFFMVDYKEQQRKKGINYRNMAEVADAAGPLWRDAPPHIRSKFETIAKIEKQKANVPEKKFTSTGIPLSEIERQAQEVVEAEEHERQDIKNIVTQKFIHKTLLTQDFYLMDVNSYCQVGGDYIIGESTILRFNIQNGILDHYHENINPGVIPMGYASDMKISCKELGLEMPFDEPDQMNYKEKYLSRMIDYMTQQGKVKPLPPIFTLPDKVEPVRNFIQQMCYRAEEDDRMFRVYKLDRLFFTLANTIRSTDDEGFPKESLALARLKQDPFKYSPGIGCEHHTSMDLCIECSTSRCKRWAFCVLDACCPLLGVPVRAGEHLPFDFDVETILANKESGKNRMSSLAAGLPDTASSCNTSILNSSLNESIDTEKSYKPMRMPKKDYSQMVKQVPSLTSSTSNFPKLSASRGRGRGLSSSFDDMKINK